MQAVIMQGVKDMALSTDLFDILTLAHGFIFSKKCLLSIDLLKKHEKVFPRDQEILKNNKHQ